MKKIIIAFGLIACCFSVGIAQRDTITIFTPHYSKVQGAYTNASQINYTQLQWNVLADSIYRAYGGAILLEYDNGHTNCHGYAWHTYDVGNKVGIDYPGPSIYWEDYSYVEVPENMATKVYYHPTGDHSAVRLSSGWYQSKWGMDGPLVRHLPNETKPIFQPSLPKKYYTRLTLIGPNIICSSGSSTFSVPNASGLTWNQSSNLGRSGSGNSVSIYKSGSDGLGWVSINNGVKELAKINVWVGDLVLSIR